MKKFILLILFPIITFSQENAFVTGKQLLDNKQYSKLETLMFNYIKQNPNDLKGIELLGDAYGYQKKWEPAYTEYKKLVDNDYNNANYHFKYGGALGMYAKSVNKFSALTVLGDIKNAFLKAVQLDPKHVEARWALVQLYMELPGIVGGSKTKALKYANELENLSKVDGYLAKGFIYESDDEPKLAESSYKMAITIGGSLTCFNKLTNLYEKQNQPDRAIANIEQAQAHSKLQNHRNTLHYQIGKIAANYNFELDKGEYCLKTYIENYTAKDSVELEWAYLRLAQIYKLKNNKQEALNWVNKAIAIRSDFPEAEAEKKQITSI